MNSNKNQNKFILIFAALLTILRVFSSVNALYILTNRNTWTNKSSLVCYFILLALVITLVFFVITKAVKESAGIIPYFAVLFIVNSAFWNLIGNNRNMIIFLLTVLALLTYKRSSVSKALLPVIIFFSAFVYRAYLTGVLPSVLLLALVQYVDKETVKNRDTVFLNYGTDGLFLKISLCLSAVAAVVGNVFAFKFKQSNAMNTANGFLYFPELSSFTALQLIAFLIPCLLVSLLTFVFFFENSQKKNNKKLQSFFTKAGVMILFAFILEGCSYFINYQQCPLPFSLFLTPALVWRMQKIGNRCVAETSSELEQIIKKHFILTALIIFALAVFYFSRSHFLTGILINDRL